MTIHTNRLQSINQSINQFYFIFVQISIHKNKLHSNKQPICLFAELFIVCYSNDRDSKYQQHPKSRSDLLFLYLIIPELHMAQFTLLHNKHPLVQSYSTNFHEGPVAQV